MYWQVQFHLGQLQDAHLETPGWQSQLETKIPKVQAKIKLKLNLAFESTKEIAKKLGKVSDNFVEFDEF